MTISADQSAAQVTLDALRLIREELGGKTILGVSNISFGLPTTGKSMRPFSPMALQNGLNAAISNPNV